MQSPVDSGEQQGIAPTSLRALAAAPSSSAESTPALPLMHSTHVSSSWAIPRKRQQVLAACEICRTRKAKCNAGRPKCGRCRERNLDCVYRTEEDTETPHRALKRKFDELQRRNDLFDELFNILKLHPEHHADEILRRLRQGQSVEELLRYTRDGDLFLQLSLRPNVDYRFAFPRIPGYKPPEDEVWHQWFGQPPPSSTTPWLLPSPDEESERRPIYLPINEEQYRYGRPFQPFSAAVLEDARLEKIKASSWTNVTMEDWLFRELIATFFQHENLTYHFVNKDTFLDDMVEGVDRFCSHLLVNAVLALACYGNRRFVFRSKFWDPSNPGWNFLAEARRLWDLEQHERRITTIQAGMILNLIYNCDGVDKFSKRFISRTLLLAEEMDLMTLTKAECPRWRAAIATTAWSLFCWTSLLSFHYYTTPPLKKPPALALADPDTPENLLGETHLRYPNSPRLVPMHFHATFKAAADFSLIVNDINECCFTEKKQRPFDTNPSLLAGFRSRLTDWFNQLPIPLISTSIVAPCHLQLHMHYYNVLICLFQDLAIKQDGDEPLALPENLDPRSIVSSAKECLQSLVRIYYLRHGFESCDTFLLSHLTKLSYLSLNTPSEPDAQFTLVLCAKGLYDQGKNIHLSRIVFHLIYALAEKTPARRMLAEFVNPQQENEEDRVTDRMIDDHVQSSWPVNQINVTDDPEVERLDEIFKLHMLADDDDDEEEEKVVEVDADGQPIAAEEGRSMWSDRRR